MSKFKQIGIKAKVMLGCIVLAMVLFVSGIISIFEYNKMSDYTSNLLTGNIISINAARDLLEDAEAYNLRLMSGINTEMEDMDFSRDDFVITFAEMKGNFITAAEKAMADSVMYAYAAYMQVTNEAPQVWLNDENVRRDWFFNRLEPIYVQLRSYIQDLTFISQDVLLGNSQTLQENYYRGIMPALISVIVGLVTVVLFYYYLCHYMINPLLKISKGIKNYRQYNKVYDVKLDSVDELQQLNENVDDILDLNLAYKRQLQQ